MNRASLVPLLVLTFVLPSWAEVATFADALEYDVFDAPVLEGASALSVRFAEVSASQRQSIPSFLDYHCNESVAVLGDADANQQLLAPLSMTLQLDHFLGTEFKLRLGAGIDVGSLVPAVDENKATLYSALGLYQLAGGFDLGTFVSADAAYRRVQLRVAQPGSDTPQRVALREATRTYYRLRLDTGSLLRSWGVYPFLDALQLEAPADTWVRGYHAVADWRAGVLDGLISWGYSAPKDLWFSRAFARDSTDLVEGTLAWQSDGSPLSATLTFSPVTLLLNSLHISMVGDFFEYYHTGVGYRWPQGDWVMQATALTKKVDDGWKSTRSRPLAQILVFFPLSLAKLSDVKVETAFLIPLGDQ